MPEQKINQELRLKKKKKWNKKLLSWRNKSTWINE